MTRRGQRDKQEDILGAPAGVPGRDAVPGRAEFLEILGLTPAAGAFVLFVVRPEITEALVHTLAASTAGLVH
ncbi:hypothetical protein FM076_28270 [Streptomyces albus subsp. chlorinus]|uniref:hypothetical protein n=1 Tax=Streptomyces albus TaxID=1888 RepID=UPI0015711EA1|nr:hypothetical protein [Streptomyces albus]NSC24841.1 hypothetical protein [Streptomyces albus subsp. chlorinus]